MTEFFKHVKGGFTIYVGGEDVEIADVRFVLAYFGEDATKVIEAFWQERRGEFSIVPLFAYGGVPRRELCTQQSLVGALQTVTLEPGSFTEMKWRKLCAEMNVAWPKRLQGKAA
jgi:hypothetical protein